MKKHPYYTLCGWDKDNGNWIDMFGSYIRAECVAEKEWNSDDSVSHLTIIKTDDTAQAMMEARDLLPIPARYRKG